MDPGSALAAPELPATSASIGPLIERMRGQRVVVLAGAGCSTDSGIPDYRGPEGSLRARRPIQYQEFVGSEEARIRYWARSAVGWRRVAGARPNDGHQALARLEQGGIIRGIITQNVDGLHHAAGSRRVVELHGSLGWVRCLGCGEAGGREAFQERLLKLNDEWSASLSVVARDGPIASAPDGDAELPASALSRFRVPECSRCGGIIKPDVVFFGENVPRPRVDEAWALYGESDLLLVLGSSLTVYSGRRFIYAAERDGIPVAIINIGPTRADGLAVAKVEGRLSLVLPRIADALLPRDPARSAPSPSR